MAYYTNSNASAPVPMMLACTHDGGDTWGGISIVSYPPAVRGMLQERLGWDYAFFPLPLWSDMVAAGATYQLPSPLLAAYGIVA